MIWVMTKGEWIQSTRMMDLDDVEEDDEMVTIGSSNKWQLN